MEKRIGPSFKKTKSLIYSKDKDGFYVYVKPNLCDTDSVVKYICRYLGRPVIATSCIDSYVQETLPVLDFIQLLIQHIPESSWSSIHGAR